MSPILHGADIQAFDAHPEVLAWLWGGAKPTSETVPDTFDYGVLQCTDSFVWGICTDGVWRWSSSVEPHTPQSPGVIAPQTHTLLEARLFGTEAELLLWRSGNFADETFCGRILRDASADETVAPLTAWTAFSPPTDQPKHPRKEKQRLAAYVETLADGFVRRTQTNGCITVTPAGSYIRLKHYLEEDTTTGVLRIAATRFVSIETLLAPKESEN